MTIKAGTKRENILLLIIDDVLENGYLRRAGNADKLHLLEELLIAREVVSFKNRWKVEIAIAHVKQDILQCMGE